MDVFKILNDKTFKTKKYQPLSFFISERPYEFFITPGGHVKFFPVLKHDMKTFGLSVTLPFREP